jgi:hypothetical protein
MAAKSTQQMQQMEGEAQAAPPHCFKASTLKGGIGVLGLTLCEPHNSNFN